MKKVLVAFTALATAFTFTSCDELGITIDVENEQVLGSYTIPQSQTVGTFSETKTTEVEIPASIFEDNNVSEEDIESIRLKSITFTIKQPVGQQTDDFSKISSLSATIDPVQMEEIEVVSNYNAGAVTTFTIENPIGDEDLLSILDGPLTYTISGELVEELDNDVPIEMTGVLDITFKAKAGGQ